MTDDAPFQSPIATPVIPSSSLISTTLIVYALFGVGAISALASSGFPLIAPLMGVIGIVAVILAYIKRDEAAGTWLQSHYRWLIRTFWYSFVWGVVGGLILITLGLVLIGIPIAFAIWILTTIWVIYRLLRGFLLFNESKPVPGM